MATTKAVTQQMTAQPAEALNASQMLARSNRIQEVMKAVMKPDTHYGVIPGTKKFSLLKPGSEVLLMTFQIAAEPEVEDLSTPDEVRYRVRCVGRHQVSGIVLGVGVGECSSNEDKYRWRAAVCQQEFDETPTDRRREKWSQGQSGPFKKLQVRTVPADFANTVLKIAKKRAQLDMTLTATGASDIFTQDQEDGGGSGGGGGGDSGPRTNAGPTSTPSNSNKASVKQVGMIKQRLKGRGIPEAEYCQHFGIASVEDTEWRNVDSAVSWISNWTPPEERGDKAPAK